jgi:hypothetical protein
MATTRKRSSGFSTTVEDGDQDFLEVAEALTTAEETEEAVTEVLVSEVKTESEPFVERSIAPTPDLGPRFIEEVETPTPEPKKTPKLQPRPKRQPRNVPRFSRTR